MIYEKECPICGAYFTTETKTRKYCDKCIDNSGHKSEQAERELARSRRKYQRLILVKYNCELCGKEHSVPSTYLPKLKIKSSCRSSWDGNDHYYCCVEHLNQDVHDHTKCSNCGKFLKDCSYSYNPAREHNYCSAECEAQHQDKIAEENGWKHKCVNCGKEFIRKAEKAYFCCQECSYVAKKKGWKSPETIEKAAAKKAKQVQVEHKCAFCKSSFYKVYGSKLDAELASRETQFCSKDCRQKWYSVQKAQSKEQKEIERFKKITKKTERKPDEPLCVTCRVSYKNCERMKSNFRILPEGAHYDNKGILIECPKYRGILK